jgi:hypothetical protein
LSARSGDGGVPAPDFWRKGARRQRNKKKYDRVLICVKFLETQFPQHKPENGHS